MVARSERTGNNMPCMTLTAAFAHFGVSPRNPRWSWSARSEDGKTIVITIWQDAIAEDGSVNFFGHGDVDRWSRQIGNRFRIEDLKTALEQSDGVFSVISIVARNPDAVPRSIIARHPEDNFKMKVRKLNEETGEFCAKRV